VYPVAIALTTLLAEINTMLLPGMIFIPAFGGYLPVVILANVLFMLIVWCWVCWRAWKRILPAPPETIAGTLSYLCESRLPDVLQHMKGLDGKERRRAVRSLGREYDLTLKPGSDGAMRWTIDFRD
jgi:hypothetical protein